MDAAQEQDNTDPGLIAIVEKACAPPPPCTHGDDDAVHTEAWNWAMSLAEKWHKEAPPLEKDDELKHTEYCVTQTWNPDVLASYPGRRDGCNYVNRSLLASVSLRYCMRHCRHSSST